MNKLPYYEKVGYAMGDAAANLVWRGALAYLAVFYTDTFGLTAAAAAMLFLVVRLTDGVTDIVSNLMVSLTDLVTVDGVPDAVPDAVIGQVNLWVIRMPSSLPNGSPIILPLL